MPSPLRGFYDIEERRLRAKLDGVRLAISHPGEKGRVLENEVSALLRSILPAEYGVSTGFIAYCKGETVGLSSQLDIIIYDALHCSPLIEYETCGIFPLEGVYGYVEVKTCLDSTSLSEIMNNNAEIRGLTQRWYWSIEYGSPPAFRLVDMEWNSVRAFVFSFDSNLGAGLALSRMLQRKAKESNAHLHGVFIGNRGFFSPHRVPEAKIIEDVPEDLPGFFFTTVHPLSAFKVMLIKYLASFPRCLPGLSPAVDRYYYDFVELSEGA